MRSHFAVLFILIFVPAAFAATSKKAVSSESNRLPATSAKLRTGTAGGGGGKGVVCYHPGGGIKSVEVLDLWEARILYKRNIKSSSASVEEQVMNALYRMRNLIWWSVPAASQGYGPGYKLHKTRVQKYGVEAINEPFLFELEAFAENFLTHKEDLTVFSDVDLSLTEDSLELIQPRDNCRIEQIVTYLPIGSGYANATILLNSRLWNQLNNTHKAALIAHESLYGWLRFRAHESNSIRVRRAIGIVFSGHEFKSVSEKFTAENYLCTSLPKKRFDPPATELIVTEKLEVIPVKMGGVYALGFDKSGRTHAGANFFDPDYEIGFYGYSSVDYEAQGIVSSNSLEVKRFPVKIEGADKIELKCRSISKFDLKNGVHQ